MGTPATYLGAEVPPARAIRSIERGTKYPVRLPSS